MATVLEDGLPPGKLHEYALIVPSGSLPEPEKDTDCPADTVMSPVGAEIVADGDWLGAPTAR